MAMRGFRGGSDERDERHGGKQTQTLSSTRKTSLPGERRNTTITSRLLIFLLGENITFLGLIQLYYSYITFFKAHQNCFGKYPVKFYLWF